MEKMTSIFFVIIVVYLVFSFIKSRKKDGVSQSTTSSPVSETSEPAQQECTDRQRAAIAAVIAAVMGEATYVLKRVYAIATVDEKKSGWKNAGRIESMSKKTL